MTFLDTVKSGLETAVDTVSEVTQSIIEKNRANAQLNRLRAVMKSECEMINRAYITLGKYYYENKQSESNDACPNEEELFEIIEKSKANIQKARERYRQVVESQNVELVTEYDIEDLEDITVSCSNEDEYEASPFTQQSEEPVEKEPEEIVADVIEKAKKNAEAIADEAEEAEDVADEAEEAEVSPAEEVAEEATEVAEDTELF